MDKAEVKRAAIIAQQAARQQAEQPAAAGPPAKRKMNWAATAPLRPRPGRPPKGPPQGR